MTTAKHTPGPWSIQSESGYCWDVGIESKYVAEIQTGSDGESELDPAERAENHSNAMLIAAAPDLLAALEFVVKNVAADLTHYEADKVIDIARAAIAKALTGESK